MLSSRPIGAGGLASRDPSYFTSARAAVGTLRVDSVGVHPYEERVPSNYPTPTWGRGNMSDLLDRYLAFGLPLCLPDRKVAPIARDLAACFEDRVENRVR